MEDYATSRYHYTCCVIYLSVLTFQQSTYTLTVYSLIYLKVFRTLNLSIRNSPRFLRNCFIDKRLKRLFTPPLVFYFVVIWTNNEHKIQYTFSNEYFSEKTIFHASPYNSTVKQALCLPDSRSNYPIRTCHGTGVEFSTTQLNQ